MRRTLLVFAILFAAVALGQSLLGVLFQLGAPVSTPTCAVSTVNTLYAANGGAGQGASKLCVCRSDGAATPAYQWCSLTFSGAATVVCAGGSTTVCP